ncbi:MAG: hypothetical protein WC588_04500 [Candidatus Micrarchaeia archaeon]
MAQKEKGKNAHNGALALLAAILVLLSALVDPRLSFALAVVAMFGLSFTMKSKFWRQVPFTIASVMVAMTVVVVLNQGEGELVPAAAISGLVCLIILWLMFQRRKDGAILNDERTVAIHNRAMAYSWWVGYLTIAILFWFDYTDYLKLTAVQFGGAMLFVMLISQALIKRYLLSKGE